MIPPGSRYEVAERRFALAHVYNTYGYPILEGESHNFKIRVASRETTYLMTEFTSRPIPTVEYYAKDTENIQFLGYKFLGDAKRWWEVANENPQVWYPLDMSMGAYLRVPTG